MNYIEEWSKSIIQRPSAKLIEPVEVAGVRNAHLGPRWEYAMVKIRAEPSDKFEVRFELPREEGSEQATYMDAAIMGLLDAVLVSEPSPMIGIRVTLVGMETHEVDSSPGAFRMAGRDAGRNLLKAARERALTPPA